MANRLSAILLVLNVFLAAEEGLASSCPIMPCGQLTEPSKSCSALEVSRTNTFHSVRERLRPKKRQENQKDLRQIKRLFSGAFGEDIVSGIEIDDRFPDAVDILLCSLVKNIEAITDITAKRDALNKLFEKSEWYVFQERYGDTQPVKDIMFEYYNARLSLASPRDLLSRKRKSRGKEKKNRMFSSIPVKFREDIRKKCEEKDVTFVVEFIAAEPMVKAIISNLKNIRKDVERLRPNASRKGRNIAEKLGIIFDKNTGALDESLKNKNTRMGIQLDYAYVLSTLIGFQYDLIPSEEEKAHARMIVKVMKDLFVDEDGQPALTCMDASSFSRRKRELFQKRSALFTYIKALNISGNPLYECFMEGRDTSFGTGFREQSGGGIISDRFADSFSILCTPGEQLRIRFDYARYLYNKNDNSRAVDVLKFIYTPKGKRIINTLWNRKKSLLVQKMAALFELAKAGMQNIDSESEDEEDLASECEESEYEEEDLASEYEEESSFGESEEEDSFSEYAAEEKWL